MHITKLTHQIDIIKGQRDNGINVFLTLDIKNDNDSNIKKVSLKNDSKIKKYILGIYFI